MRVMGGRGCAGVVARYSTCPVLRGFYKMCEHPTEVYYVGTDSDDGVWLIRACMV